jgi:hypothetical protein
MLYEYAIKKNILFFLDKNYVSMIILDRLQTYLQERQINMQSFCRLFLFLLIIINSLNCFDSSEDENEIYRKLYSATNRTLASILPPNLFGSFI